MAAEARGRRSTGPYFPFPWLVPRLVAFTLLGAGLVSCTTQLGPIFIPGPAPSPSQPRSEPMVDRLRSYYGGDFSRPRKERDVLILPDRTIESHGREAEWYPEGNMRSERFYRHAEPTGIWRTWHTNGKPRSLVSFEDPTLPAEMIWWHANGQESSRVTAYGGVRQGDWVAWNEEGGKISEGFFNSNMRASVWTFWHDDGSLAEYGEYRDGVRVGHWRRWEEGAVFELPENPLSPPREPAVRVEAGRSDG